MADSKPMMSEFEDSLPGEIMNVGLLESLPLRLRLPYLTLRVSDADHDGVFVVRDTFSRVYGEGSDPQLAIRDSFDSLLSRFLDLEEHESILAPGLRQDLATMRQYIAHA